MAEPARKPRPRYPGDRDQARKRNSAALIPVTIGADDLALRDQILTAAAAAGETVAAWMRQAARMRLQADRCATVQHAVTRSAIP